ncbi:MAG: TonB family protein [Pseudomonadota bacterium]
MSAAKFVLSRRLLIALTVSALLHGALIYGVRLPKARNDAAVPLLEVRIVSSDILFGKSAAVPEPVTRDTTAPNVIPRPHPAPQAATLPQALDLLQPAPADIPQPGAAADTAANVPDGPPSLLAPVEPAYPEQARARDVTGQVTLLLLIDENGTVKEVTVVASEPQGVFDESALSAFHAARFSPAMKAGRAVPSRMVLQVLFDLNESGSVR